LLATGCNTSSFQGGDSKKSAADGKSADTRPPPESRTNQEGSANTSQETVKAQGGFVIERFVGEQKVTRTDVDILFAMDTSGSMATEKSFLEENMADFIKRLNSALTGTNYRVFMIGKDFTFPTIAGPLQIVDYKVSSTDSLIILQEILQDPSRFGINLREDTNKHLVVVTDDDAQGVTASLFRDHLQGNPKTLGRARFNAIAILPNSNLNHWCTKAKVGTQYIELTRDKLYGGLLQDLCSADWGGLLQKLADNIIRQQIKYIFKLKKTPNPTRQMTVMIDGQDIGRAAWTYKPSSKAVVLAKDVAPQYGQILEVRYVPQG
jgi:hypothetical protein